MRLRQITEAVGRITKQNQTADVGPQEIKTQAAKFGNTVDKDGRPPTLSKKTKGSKTNVLFNLGLAESIFRELDIPRNQMPQIGLDDLKKDYDLETDKVDPSELQTSQDQRIPGMVDKTVKSIKNGFNKPLVIDKNGFIVNGHHRYDAYLELGVSQVPVIRVKDASITELVKDFSHTAKDTYAEDSDREIGIHRSSDDFAVIDLSKSADGTFWLNGVDNTDWDSTVTSGAGVDMAFEISPRAELASYDDIDKYSTGELENMGYDGVRMVDGENISYQIWNTDVLKRVDLDESIAVQNTTPSNVCPRTKADMCQCESIQTVSESNDTLTAVCVLEQSDTVEGTILLKQQSDGPTLIVGEITGLEPGEHGFHIHEFGDLSNGCESAGGHYNPDEVDHGDLEQGHVGDLGNVTADENGVARVSIAADRVDLGGERSVVGRSIVIHSDQDDLGKGGDEESLKTGNAGDRLACGVISLKENINEKWSKKYKSSINCSNPKGFSQKAHCAGKNKKQNEDVDLDTKIDLEYFLDQLKGDRDKDAFLMRHKYNMTFKEMGKEWGVTLDRARQIYLQAERRMRYLLRNYKETNENFADGKKKGKSRPGRFKKAGVSCKGSVTDLRKKAKNSSGEKQKGYHWCANMKSGRQK